MLELASLPATTSLTTVSSAHAGIAQPPQRNATYVLCVPKETQESGLEKLLPASRKRPTALVLLVRTFFIKASYMPPIMVSSPSQFPACQDSSPGSQDRSEALIQSSHCRPARANVAEQLTPYILNIWRTACKIVLLCRQID